MSTAGEVKMCPLCDFTCGSVQEVLSHLLIIHSSDPKFNVVCGLNGCAATSKSFTALYSHIYRKHPGIIKRRSLSAIENISPQQKGECFSSVKPRSDFCDLAPSDAADVSYVTGEDVNKLKRSSALFILKLKEQRRITQVAIDDVVEGSRALFCQVMEHMKAGVRAKLASAGVDCNLDEVYEDPFSSINTCYLQEKYFREELDLIEPTEIKIGSSEFVPQFSGNKRRLVEKWDMYHYVPLLKSLSNLLKDNTVLDEIQQTPNRINSGGYIADFCDGTRFSKHELFSKDPHALQILAYFDEVELVNPLGSHVKKHKVGVTLGNISPKFRSQLRLIHLALIATVPIIEAYGLNKILEPFVKDLNVLASEGISVSVNGIERKVKGALLTFMADNLGSNDLGGFKKSFSFAYRSCRTCLVTNDALSNHFTSESCVMREMEKHKKFLEKLNGPTREHFSKTYGINHHSVLMDVQYFDMFGGGLPHDIMHDVFEGVAPLEIKLLLNVHIANKNVTLAEFNDRLLNFNYGYSESDKPIPVLARSLQPSSTIRSTASQMMILVRILPFILGDKVPKGDKHWTCFLLLRKIIDIVLSPMVSEQLCSSLKLLVTDHNKLFIELYGENAYIPKLHFLLHYPEQMKAIGPMVCSWTIRHEAKLNFFKRASRLSNFKNITYTLANNHQRWLCYQLVSSKLVESRFECGPPKSGSGCSQLKGESVFVQSSLLSILPEVDIEATIFRPTWVRKDGILYQANNAYLIIDFDGLDPVFGRLEDILVITGCYIVYQVSLCRVLYFDDHYHAYVLFQTSEQLLAMNLRDLSVYHGHKVYETTYISLKYYIQ